MKQRFLFFPLLFLMMLSACLPTDPYTLRAAADGLIEGTRAAQTETAEAVVRENQAAVLQQMQTQASHDNAATATAQVLYSQATATALEHDAQATQAAATARAIETQEAQIAASTRQAVELAQLQAGATATQQAAVQAASAEAARVGREKVITILLWLAVFVAIGLITFLGFEFARMFTRTMGNQRAWVPGAETFLMDSQAGPVLVQPRKMFSPGMQVNGQTGAMVMPQLAPPDAQMYTTLAALAVELQREVAKRAQWFTPVGGGGKGETFAPMLPQDEPAQLPMPEQFAHLAPLPMLTGRHILIAGPTGGGKSYAARYLLQARKTAYVLDPHFKPGEWPEHCQVIGGGRNFEAIATLVHRMTDLMDSRFKQRERGNTIFNPVHLVTDELPAIVAHAPGVTNELMEIAREGRKVGVFLMLLTQSPLVKTLGLEGQGDARDNFATILLNALAPGLPEDSPRQCTVVVGNFKKPESRETYLIPAHVPGLNYDVPAHVPGVPEARFDVPRLLENEAGTGNFPLGTDVPTSGNGKSLPPEPGSAEETDLIHTLYGLGYSVERIYNLLGGRKENTVARVRAVLGTLEGTDD